MSGASQRVPLQEVRDLIGVGEPLPFKVYDAEGRLLLAEGQSILGDRQFESLIERGAWAESELVKALRLGRQDGRERTSPVGSAHKSSLERKASLFDRWEQLVWSLDAVLRPALKSMNVQVDLRELVDEVIGLIELDADIALFEAIRQDDRRFALYALRHGIHSAVVCWIVARQYPPTAAKARELVIAALCMNVSILGLQADMAEQKEPPTRKQLELIRAHPEKSVQIMQAAGLTDPVVLQLIREHHEHTQGGGYPSGAPVTDPAARLLRLADIYMAKVSPRAFRAPLPAPVAGAQMFKEEQGSDLSKAMVQSLGLYPPGTWVTLQSGEWGVVKHRATAQRTSAVVCALTDAQGRPISGTNDRLVGEAGYAIKAPAAGGAATQRVLPERIYGLRTLPT
jgi:HD-GYP domain-containing protein (c-di-GMP phosphodiesterase class II)